jgi:hypothetical protein
MSHDVYYQFITTPGQARRAGARGGKATVRNRRERLDRTPAEVPEPKAGSQSSLETTAAAIALLDTQYPWLRGAEKRFWNRSSHAACEAVLPSSAGNDEHCF